MRKFLTATVIVAYSLMASGCPIEVARNQHSDVYKVQPPHIPPTPGVNQQDVQKNKELNRPNYELPSLYQK